jgi:hypothetical protein
MTAEEQGPLPAVDPDARPARAARAGTGRGTARGAEAEEAQPEAAAGAAPAEATLSLEPLRLPLTAMVRDSLRAERTVLERLGADLRAELERLHEWRVREEAMRADQTALYRQAAEHWRAAGAQAAGLNEAMDRVGGAARTLHAVVEAAIGRMWRRALVAAVLVGAVGLSLIAALCGVVWLALTQH